MQCELERSKQSMDVGENMLRVQPYNCRFNAQSLAWCLGPRMKLETLYERTGSQSTFREFKRMIKTILDNQEHIPDYTFELTDGTVYMRPRPDFKEKYKTRQKNSVNIGKR